jgi:cytidine deaminase
MKAENFRERRVEIDGWPVNVSSYQLGAAWRAKADNVSPGANLARAEAATRDAAEQQVLDRARELLGRTKRRQV